jgi:uncharacterized coiled-coil protein SlyX
MKCLFPAVVLALLWGLGMGWVPSAFGQEDLTSTVRDAELDAAILARRESAEFERRIRLLQEAQAAQEAAIAALPEVAEIDREVTQLQQQLGELLARRVRVLDAHAAELALVNAGVEAAKQALLDADPVRQLLDARRVERSGEEIAPTE